MVKATISFEIPEDFDSVTSQETIKEYEKLLNLSKLTGGQCSILMMLLANIFITYGEYCTEALVTFIRQGYLCGAKNEFIHDEQTGKIHMSPDDPPPPGHNLMRITFDGFENIERGDGASADGTSTEHLIN
jgi:hypothetical protein